MQKKKRNRNQYSFYSSQGWKFKKKRKRKKTNMSVSESSKLKRKSPVSTGTGDPSVSTTTTTVTKKKKSNNDTKNSVKKSTNNSKKSDIEGYTALSIEEIRESIIELSKRVPTVNEEGMDPDDKETVTEWASQLQTVLEEFNLLLNLITPASYKWGSERSGAADQNLTVLNTELSASQEQIQSSVAPRLTNILSPMVDMVVCESTYVETTFTPNNNNNNNNNNNHNKNNDVTTTTTKKVKTNKFSREEVDPAFVKLCRTILCRNAKYLRQVVLANFHKVTVCLQDYLKATKKDSHHDRSGFSY